MWKVMINKILFKISQKFVVPKEWMKNIICSRGWVTEWYTALCLRHIWLWVRSLNLHCLWTHLQVHGWKRLGYHADLYSQQVSYQRWSHKWKKHKKINPGVETQDRRYQKFKTRESVASRKMFAIFLKKRMTFVIPKCVVYLRSHCHRTKKCTFLQNT